MTDRGAIESIADELVEMFGGSGTAIARYDAMRILDRLTADGWALFHVESRTAAAELDSVWDLIRRAVTDPLVLAAVDKAECGESKDYVVVKAKVTRTALRRDEIAAIYLKVSCRYCRAEPSEWCRTRDRRRAVEFHTARFYAARTAGLLPRASGHELVPDDGGTP